MIHFLPSTVCLILLLAAATATAQSDTAIAPAMAADSVAAFPQPLAGGMTKSPTTAILLSLIPGGGQIYNEQYWKAPLFAGVAGFFLVQAIRYHNLYQDQADVVNATPETDVAYARLKRIREIYRDERDLNIAYYLGVDILCMVDAYVGAHLFDFNVDDDLTSRIWFNPVRPGIGVTLQW
ncbi:MAG: hypothetical protein IT211_03855 [Armatimonadetes bacterium]|nr:hypothetical protein [Armatimonadota bacterium]